MQSKPASLADVVQRAKEVFGSDAEWWLLKPSKNLDGLSPYELAKAPDGAKAVLFELERHGSMM